MRSAKFQLSMVLHWFGSLRYVNKSKFHKQSSELLNMSHDVYKLAKKLRRHFNDSFNIQALNENEE